MARSLDSGALGSSLGEAPSTRLFRDPGLGEGITLAYRATIRKSGQTVGTGHASLSVEQDRYVSSGRAELPEGVAFSAAAVLRREDGFVRAESADINTWDGDRLVARDEVGFIGARVLQWGAKIGEFPQDVMPLLGVPVVMAGMLGKGARHDFPVWLANVLFWDVRAKVEKREEITVPLGRMPAWRIRFRPYFGHMSTALDRLMSVVVPPFILHLADQPPHPMLRFEFPTGPFPWNPHAVLEATEWSGPAQS